MVYVSLPSSWTMRKEIQQFWESFSLHCLLTSVDFSATWMLGQAWEQFFSKGPLKKNLHSTQELQNRRPQLTSAGAEALSPGFGCGWALPQDPHHPLCHLRVRHSHVSAAGRGAAGAVLAEGGLVSPEALAAVAVAGPAVAALVATDVQAAFCRLLALAGAALVAGRALALPAVTSPAICGRRPFRPGSYRKPGCLPSARTWRASPTPGSPCHSPWDRQGGPVGWCGQTQDPQTHPLAFWQGKAASPWGLNLSRQAENPSCRCVTFAAAGRAVVKLAVHVVALAEGAVDLLVGHVAGVADALPAHAVPQP